MNSRIKTRLIPGGFALVVTLSLMVLLTVIAVGVLALSSISLRSSSQSADLAVARGNARLSLLLALGELQKAAGPDTRVTARADLVAASNPPVLGVWKSWEGTDHGNDGMPKAPDYADHKSARFVAWLTSASPKADLGEVPDTAEASGRVTLLGAKSVGTQNPAKRQIHLPPVRISAKGSNGGFAWWVSGENQKARLPQPYEPDADNPAGWADLGKNDASADTAPFGLDKILEDPSVKDPTLPSPASKTLTLQSSNLVESAASSERRSQAFFHDLSVTSVGLLTNTATGGWRKDLSLATDNYLSLSTSGLPFFRVTPHKDILYTRATSSNPTVKNSLLYPWSDYRRGSITGNESIYRFPPIGSWANLARYATIYKNFNAVGSTSAMSTPPRAAPIGGSGNAAVDDFIHNVRILPLIARIQWIYHHVTVPITTGANAGKYDVNLAVQPVITLWNPYNVTLTAPGAMTFELQGSLPPAISYTICGVPQPQRITLQTGSGSATITTSSNIRGAFSGAATYTLPNPPAFGPGETRVFSPRGESNSLEPGYSPYTGSTKYGLSASIAKAVTPGSTSATSKIATSITFDTEFTDKAVGVGLYLNMNTSAGTVLAYRMLYDKAVVNASYPALTSGQLPSPTLSEATVPTPFLSVTFGARMASNTSLPSKGFVQTSPFVNYTAMGKKGQYEDTLQYLYPGVLHNVNSPFEFSFQALKAINDYVPNTDSKNHGFIITGFKSSNGLSRCVIGELPGRPLGSLAELQNWDARYENPVPPFAFNIVGNSDASPLLPANHVVNPSDRSKMGAENMQNDDSYCLNHMLFDDWFFSSIAAEPTNFGKPSVSSSARNIYANFLKNPRQSLHNHAYKAIPEDVSRAAISDQDATVLASTNVGVTATSYKTIASRLEVEGMFNVNSTSVTAWRALLGHARNRKIPYMGANGSPTLSGETDYAFSRFSVAGDVESQESGASGMLAGSAEYAGYRVFTSEQLDFLAQEIVNQVRLRGPFLSLSEFVNRQLSSGELAMAGAIQTALNKLSESPQNPFRVLQTDTTPAASGAVSGSNVATATPPGGASGYKFPAAAKGFNLYGLPGWTRQADVLRTLAPILSARDDTFTIRAYGDARDSSGKIVKARAVCEATVRRGRDFVDRSDDPALASLSGPSGAVNAKSAVNDTFGRRFEIIAFRWLSPDEI